jgi:hypothetical protein
MLRLGSNANQRCPRSPSAPEVPCRSGSALLYTDHPSGPVISPASFNHVSTTHIYTCACPDIPEMTAIAISRGVPFRTPLDAERWRDTERMDAAWIPPMRMTVRHLVLESNNYNLSKTSTHNRLLNQRRLSLLSSKEEPR